MEIFLIISLVLIILLLLTINSKLGELIWDTDKIREMTQMSDKERYEYSLEKDEPERYKVYVEDEYWREQTAKKKKEDDDKN